MVVMTYFGRSIRQIRMKCRIRCQVVFLGEAKINENRNILVRKKNVSRSIERCQQCDNECKAVNLLDVIVHHASLMKELDTGKQKSEPFTRL